MEEPNSQSSFLEILKFQYGRVFNQFGLTNAYDKDFPVQLTIFKAVFFNTVIQFMSYVAHTLVKDDLTLRIYFENSETKKRVAIAQVIWLGLCIYLVSL